MVLLFIRGLARRGRLISCGRGRVVTGPSFMQFVCLPGPARSRVRQSRFHQNGLAGPLPQVKGQASTCCATASPAVVRGVIMHQFTHEDRRFSAIRQILFQQLQEQFVMGRLFAGGPGHLLREYSVYVFGRRHAGLVKEVAVPIKPASGLHVRFSAGGSAREVPLRCCRGGAPRESRRQSVRARRRGVAGPTSDSGQRIGVEFRVYERSGVSQKLGV